MMIREATVEKAVGDKRWSEIKTERNTAPVIRCYCYYYHYY
jgi:hypothetical protein